MCQKVYCFFTLIAIIIIINTCSSYSERKPVWSRRPITTESPLKNQIINRNWDKKLPSNDNNFDVSNRALFDTNPKCAKGFVFIRNHCRKEV